MTADTRPTQGPGPLTERWAAVLAGRTWDDVGAEAAAKAKLCMLDYLSCALVAHDLPWSRQAIEVASDNSGLRGAADAMIVGTAYRVSPHDAVFANAVLGHALVRDDMHLGSVSHLGVVVMPVLMAFMEAIEATGLGAAPAMRAAPAEVGAGRGAAGVGPGSVVSPTGKDLLAAIVCGYEVGGKLGRAILDVDVARIFRPTGIAGPLAGAAAGAKLLGLDAARTAGALALASNTAAGYNEWASTGGSEMFFHVGFAARNAMTAAQLAAVGAYASPTAVDGRAGLLAAFRKPLAPDVPEPFADGPEILSVFFKPVPACNYAQSPAQAARTIALRDRPEPAAIDRVEARVTSAAAAYPGCDASGPFEHVLQAKMSIQWNVAVALVKGAFDEASYRPPEQPEVAQLAARTRLEVDAELTGAYPRRQGAEIVVHMKRGDVHRCRVPDVVPASDDEVQQRFSAAAAERLGREKAERLFEHVMTLEAMLDPVTIVRLTRTGALS